MTRRSDLVPARLRASGARVLRVGRRLVTDARAFAGHGRTRFDVIFFSGGPVDEVWIRSTLAACRRRGRRCLHIVSGASSTSVPAGAVAGSIELLRVLRGRILVTASSGLPARFAPRGCEHRVHMPHSLASLHMVYPEDAFDGYDVLFASGDHHVAEIAIIDRLRKNPPKAVHRVGYGKSDVLVGMVKGAESRPKTVLIAPSWGKENVLDTVGFPLIRTLLERGVRVVTRPHPIFFNARPELIQALERAFHEDPAFELERPGQDEHWVANADLMISDYSGVAMEFAFTRARPVVFVDVAKKVRNENYLSVGLTPLEIGIRTSLGVVVPADKEAICSVVAEKLSQPGDTRSATAARDRYAYNWGHVGAAASDAIEGMLR